MGLFKKTATDPGELERLKAEISAMAQRLDRSDADKHELGNTVRGIVTRLDTPIAPPPEPPQRTSTLTSTPPPPEPGPPVATQTDIDMLNARVQRLSDRIDGIDARITAIATELANQLEELATEVGTLSTAASQPVAAGGDTGDDLSDEIAAQAASAAALASAAEAIAVEIREAQTKLANEQARYQIAFRQDLADLAERLKRS